MIKVKCINDKDKSKFIHPTEWIVKDKEYHIIYISWHPQQRCNGCLLSEVTLTEKSKPFEYYRMDRFAIPVESLEDLLELAKNCADLGDINIDELLKETEIKVLH